MRSRYGQGVAPRSKRFAAFASNRVLHMQLLFGLAVLTLWEILALTVFAHRFVLPTPTSIVATGWQDHFYGSDVLSTLGEAGLGWLLGNTLALVLAITTLASRRMENILVSFGVMTYAVPTVAIGPILFIVQSPFAAKVTMSALSVFFVTLVAGVAGLRAASRTSLEMVAAFGGTKWTALRRVRLRAGLPSVAAGLCISAPAAILGAMIGDYFGGQSGLGVVMLQAQQQLAVSRTWAIAAVTTVISGAAYAATLWLTRRFGAGTSVTTDTAHSTVSPEKPNAVRRLASLGRVLGGIAIAIGVWAIAVRESGLGGYFLKTPLAVWDYLFASAQSAQNRQAILSSLATTLLHAGTGWVLGTLLAIVGAVVLVLSPAATRAVMPLVLVVRSVPLVAMTPLLALLFGRGLLGITMIAALVTVVPSLVTISDGLASAPTPALDLIRSIGGSPLKALTRVRAMYGAPAIFTAAKISMPGAILGAVLAEWLVSGSGVGHAMALDVVGSNFSNLWASIAMVVAVSLALYFSISFLERALRSKLAIS